MAAAAPTDIGTLIYSDPSFRGGKPCIAGTGMSVQSVVLRHLQGQSPEAIADDIPDIPLAHFYAALAYYYANREWLDAEIAAEMSESDQLYKEWTESRLTHNSI
ncbi:MAG: DUF433 domain-containing protein [Dehalococcoidia bacterium]